MKKVLISLYVVFISCIIHAQSALPDSTTKKLDTAKKFETEVKIIRHDFPEIFDQNAPPEIKIKRLFPILTYFSNKGDKRIIAYTNLAISDAFSSYGNLSETVKYGIDALNQFEKLKDTAGLLNAYIEIGNGLNGSKNTEQALVYWKNGLAIAKSFDTRIYSQILNEIADGYNTVDQPDSALPYIQEAVSIDRKLLDTLSLAGSVGTLGETYMRLKEYAIAKAFINEFIQFSKISKSIQELDAGYNDLAQIYLETSAFDSSLMYARKGLSYAYPDYLIDAIRSYELIYKNFDKQNKPDSANKYYRLAMEAKDSILSDDKKKKIQAMNFQEEMRQQELQTAKQEQEKQHKENIENTLIALGIVVFAMLFLLLSRSIIVNEKIISFLAVLGLLVVFEFINLLIHPWLASVTHESSVLMLLALVLIASLLIPLHHKVEPWIKHKMVEKNKAIRLAAAKRTIEQLEKKDDDVKSEK